MSEVMKTHYVGDDCQGHVLERIEAKYPSCGLDGSPADPAEVAVVKLARALDEIRDGARWSMSSDRIKAIAERVLAVVAGEVPDAE